MRFSLVFIPIIFIVNLFAENLNSLEELVDKNQYQLIINKYSSYETNISSYPEVNYYLGIAYFKTGDYQKAESIFSELVKQNYKLANTYFNLGITKYKLKKYDEAIKYLELSKNYDITLAPECMYVIISCYLIQNKKDEALNLYRELVEQFPDSLQVLKTQELFEKYKISINKLSAYAKQPKISFYFSTEYGYDTNINMVSLEETSGNSDSYYGIIATMLFNYKQITLVPSFEKVLYSSFSSYNSDVYNLMLRYSFDKILLSVFGRQIVYGQPFNYEFGSELKFALRTVTPFIFKLVYSNKVYTENTELNTTVYQVIAEIYSDSTGRFSVGCGIKRNLTQQIFSYYSFIPSVRLVKEISRILIAKTDINYEIRKYDWQRDDRIFYSNFSLSILPVKNLEIVSSLTYTNSSSSVGYLSYQKTGLQVLLTLYFY